MLTKIVGRPAKTRTKPKGPFPALADTSSSETIIDSVSARAMGLRWGKATNTITVSGKVVPVCYREVSLQIPGTGRPLEVHRVAVATEPTGLPTILGVVFMQRTGTFLDLQNDGHDSSREDLDDVSEATPSAAPLDAELYALKQRGKWRSNRCYLYFTVDRKQRKVSIETSWLPNLRPVREALSPLGFAREAKGAWSVSADLDDLMGVVRRVTRALELLLTEATSMIASDEEHLEP